MARFCDSRNFVESTADFANFGFYKFCKSFIFKFKNATIHIFKI
ncbi:hypothetical protein [Helicobacter sp. 23-1045]